MRSVPGCAIKCGRADRRAIQGSGRSSGVEHHVANVRVVSSNLIARSNYINKLRRIATSLSTTHVLGACRVGWVQPLPRLRAADARFAPLCRSPRSGLENVEGNWMRLPSVNLCGLGNFSPHLEDVSNNFSVDCQKLTYALSYLRQETTFELSGKSQNRKSNTGISRRIIFRISSSKEPDANLAFSPYPWLSPVIGLS